MRELLRGAASASVRAPLEAWDVWQVAGSVAAFWPLRGECVVLDPWPTGKSVGLPAVVGEDLVFRVAKSPGELVMGAFGTREPGAGCEEAGRPDLILVPGLAFDRRGGRLGRGRGYYDRFLARFPDVPKAGVCLDAQVAERVPCEDHDVRMDWLVTPMGVIPCR